MANRQLLLPSPIVAEIGYLLGVKADARTEAPDRRYTNHEILFNSNEDTLTVVDVTFKDNPVQLARVPYEGTEYTHQGWLTPDQRYFLLGDELDEVEQGVNTTTYLWDVRNLTNPRLFSTYDGAYNTGGAPHAASSRLSLEGGLSREDAESAGHDDDLDRVALDFSGEPVADGFVLDVDANGVVPDRRSALGYAVDSLDLVQPRPVPLHHTGDR